MGKISLLVRILHLFGLDSLKKKKGCGFLIWNRRGEFLIFSASATNEALLADWRQSTGKPGPSCAPSQTLHLGRNCDWQPRSVLSLLRRGPSRGQTLEPVRKGESMLLVWEIHKSIIVRWGKIIQSIMCTPLNMKTLTCQVWRKWSLINPGNAWSIVSGKRVTFSLTTWRKKAPSQSSLLPTPPYFPILKPGVQLCQVQCCQTCPWMTPVNWSRSEQG